MRKILLFFSLLFFTYVICFAVDDKTTVSSKLTSATVYRNAAEMMHTAKATLKQGSNELVIEGISNAIDINSLQINCPATITILGVEFSNQFMLNENASPVLLRLKDSLKIQNELIQNINTKILIDEELIAVLKSNREIKGTQTGLSVAELMKLMDYYKTKATELQADLAALKTKRDIYYLQVSKLNNQINEEQKKNVQSAGRVILQLAAAVSGEAEFTITYLTPNANWIPYYDLKIENIKSPVQIFYKAKISQTTGLDWKKVKLSLSTSSPRSYETAPLLSTWFLSYINPVRMMEKDMSMSNTISGLKVSQESLSEVVVSGYSKVKIRGNSSVQNNSTPLYIVNNAEMSADDYNQINPSAIKTINVLSGEKATSVYGSRAVNGVVIVTLKDGLEDYVSVTNNELDVTYDIDLLYDVPTNGKPQLANLKQEKMDAVYKYYSVPKLDKEVFLLAEISDWEKLNLLPGEANIIFESTYIGKSFIDPNSTSDTLNLTLGKDKRVVVKREKLADFSSIKFWGNNTQQIITYELTVKNNKKDAINIILKDQYPISTNKEIEVGLKESDGAAVNEEIGVLTWQLNLAPGESKKVRISYSIKYPKGKVLNLQ